ncbi:hypothetical protein [Fulvimarina sp. MAC3]|uniref:hypothetical protein n=1 Tax=Fulvimarina sp. MAC3 TaxID=3148887 RepID=UPI0031FE04AC
MLKTLRIATILTGVSAFAVPAFAQMAQDNTIVPGNEAEIQTNNAEIRQNVAEDSTVNLSRPENPTANPMDETIVPGSSAGIRQNEADARAAVAESPDVATTGDMNGEGEDVLVPGSGATFSPGVPVEGQQAAEQDESPSINN